MVCVLKGIGLTLIQSIKVCGLEIFWDVAEGILPALNE